MPYTAADRIALRTLAIGLATAPFAFLFATAWLPDPESGRVAFQQGALLALATIIGLCTLALALRHRRAALAAVYHPAVALPLAIAALSTALAPLHPFPARTIEGLPASPYHHAATLFYVEIALFAAGYLVAARGPWRQMLAWAAVVAAATAGGVTAATINFEAQPWLVIHFPGWYNFVAAHILPSGYRAWIAPVGVMAAIALYRAGCVYVRVIAAIFMAWSLWIGNNATAFVDTAIALAWLLAARRFRTLRARPYRVALCALLLVMPLLVVPAAAPFIERADIAAAMQTSPTDGIPSTDPRDHIKIHLLPGRTIWSRSWMQRIVLEDVATHPSLALVGRGWGTFAESYAAHWRQVPGRISREPLPLTSQTHWDAHTSARFHPHNTLIETLSSIGLAGASLVAVLLMLPALLPRGNPGAPTLLAASLCTISGFWFLESSFAPLIAVVYAATVRSIPAAWCAHRAGMAVFALAILACLAGSAASFGRSGPPQAPGCPANEANEPATFGGYEAFLEKGLISHPAQYWLLQRLPEARALACAARYRGRPGQGLDALSEMLRLRDILFTGFAEITSLDTLFPEEVASWEADVTRLLNAAPERTDAIIPYIAWVVQHRAKETTLAALAAFRPRVSLEFDPVGSWMDACRAYLDGDAQANKRLAIAAVKSGLANYVQLQHLAACSPVPQLSQLPPSMHSASKAVISIP